MLRSVPGLLKVSTALGLLVTIGACGGENTGGAPLDAFSLLSGEPTTEMPLNGTGFGFFSARDTAPVALPAALPMRPEADEGYRLAPLYDYRSDAPTYYDDAPYEGDYGYAPGDDWSDSYFDDYRDPSYFNDDNYVSQPGSDSFAWLALASLLTGVLGDSPPDYYFDHGGVEPWVWETGDHYRRYAEPIGPGYRYYFYEPGAARPFLVRDPFYSYGYRGDRLAVIYDRYGRVLDSRIVTRHRRAASYYFDRGRELYGSSLQRSHYGVSAQRWAQRKNWIEREQRQWDRARAERQQWREWNASRANLVTARWSGEQAARRYAARRFDQWHEDGLRGTAPRFYAEAPKAPEVRRALLRQQAEHRRLAAAQRQRTERVERRTEAAVERRDELRERARFTRTAAQRDRANDRQRQSIVRRSTEARQTGADVEAAKKREHALAVRRAETREQQAVEHKAQRLVRTKAEQKQHASAQQWAHRAGARKEHAAAQAREQQHAKAQARREAKLQREAKASSEAKAQRQAQAQREAAQAERRDEARRQASTREQARVQRQAQQRERAQSEQRQAQSRMRAQRQAQAQAQRHAQARPQNHDRAASRAARREQRAGPRPANNSHFALRRER